MRVGGLVLAVVLLVLGGGVGVANAQAPGPGGQAAYVSGTVAAFLQQDASTTTSRFRQLALIGLRPGTAVSVSCSAGCRLADRTHTAGANGVVDLHEHVRGLPQRAGGLITIRVMQTDGRSRVYTIEVGTPRPSVINTFCFNPQGARANCTVTCPDSISPNCEGAGLGLPPVVIRHHVQLTRTGRTRVQQLRATNLLAGATVSMWCVGDRRGCWVGVRAFFTTAGGTLDLRRPFTRALRPGARVHIRVQHGQRVRSEFRLRFRRSRGPAARATCGGPTAFVLPATPRPVPCRNAS